MCFYPGCPETRKLWPSRGYLPAPVLRLPVIGAELLRAAPAGRQIAGPGW